MTTTPQTELFTDSAESKSAIFAELYKIVRPFIKHYETDLIKHDRRTLEGETGGLPFIYGYRESGTGLTQLLPDLKSYEDAGLRVGEKYLFGYIQDEAQKIEILYNQSASVVYKGIENKHYPYFDGKKLRKSTREQCEAIHRAHIDKVLRDAARKEEETRRAA